MKNLAVLAFPQVFFKRDTGLMFIPAVEGDEFQTVIMPQHTRRSHTSQTVDSQMMAIRELKLPMLKHSLATSMKNSITWALCFFFAGLKKVTFFCKYRLYCRECCSNTKGTLGGSNTLGKYESIYYNCADKSTAVIKLHIL